MDDLIRNIRKDLRLAMNGVASSSMREKGMNYKMNFGVDVLRLQQIAQKYEPNPSLAEEIWKLDVREMKILSTMIYPVDQFTKAQAKKWVNEIPNQEIREHLCRNLLQNLPFAHELVKQWTLNANPSIRLTGYWLYTRLMLIGSDALQKIENPPIIKQALQDVDLNLNILRTAALNVLRHLIRANKEDAEKIMSQIAHFSNSDNPIQKEIFDSLKFEFEFRG